MFRDISVVLTLLLEQRAILSALLPQKGEVQEEEDVPHDRSWLVQTSVQEGVEAHDVQGDWEKKQGSKSGALGPQAHGRNEEDDRVDDRNVAALHHNIDELERLRGTVHVWGWSREDTERTKNRSDEQKRQNNLSNGGSERGEFHRWGYRSVERVGDQCAYFSLSQSETYVPYFFRTSSGTSL